MAASDSLLYNCLQQTQARDLEARPIIPEEEPKTCLLRREDTLAEWLRRRPAKPVGSARVGSNPTGVDYWIAFFAAPNLHAEKDGLAHVFIQYLRNRT